MYIFFSLFQYYMTYLSTLKFSLKIEDKFCEKSEINFNKLKKDEKKIINKLNLESFNI